MPDEVTMNQMITAMVYEFERLNLPIPTGLISGISHQNRTKAAIEHNLRPFRRAADNLKKILAQNPDAFPAKITQRKRKAPVEKPAEAVTNEQVAKAEEQVDAEDELDTEDEIPFQAPVAKMMRTAEGKKAVYSHPQAE
ncbi:hypothetical protein L228DRAFT_246643 [Xylona heveae TC161]|uniref:Uncharacterized protein n=1 Tax=Xylona heveae (strain CBS 132557 / TC161) TaxID=1328760 RepID=A0A165HP79_XYLHT|nr:hypothetical protein L228DRAFT_246643 [Xylona heveae TC161]KZF23796.1 hypothetical protein L228DRAFT_246643 [Xylona heveae TC161]